MATVTLRRRQDTCRLTCIFPVLRRVLSVEKQVRVCWSSPGEESELGCDVEESTLDVVSGGLGWLWVLPLTNCRSRARLPHFPGPQSPPHVTD